MITKKRTMAILVTVMMVVSMLSIVTGTVYADNTQTEVTEININVTHPTAGDVFANTSNVNVTGNGFRVTRVEWCEDYGYGDNNQIIAKEDSDHLGTHGVFNPKYCYRLIIELKAMDGYVFPHAYNNSNLLNASVIHTENSSLSTTRPLSGDQKTTTIVLTGIYAFTTINVSRPVPGVETAPNVALPEFEASWYSLEGAEWCDENGENKSNADTFAEGETAYMLVHLKSKDRSYNWNSLNNLFIRPLNGSFVSVTDYSSTDKLNVLIAVLCGNPEACPEGGEHDWQRIYHKATFTDYGYETEKCRKCGSESSDIAIGGAPVSVVKLEKYSFTYTGKAIQPIVTLSGTDGPLGKDSYSVTYFNNTKVGTATVRITLKGDYFEGTKDVAFKITKAANPLKIKGKTATVKYSKLKKKNQALAVSKVIGFLQKGQGTVSYAKASGNKKISVNKTTGKVNVKKV